MTDKPAKRRRLPRMALRAIAWVAGGLAFLSPFVAPSASPKPATAGGARADGGRRVVIVRKITRRVIVQAQPSPSIRYVYPNASSGSSSSSGPSSTSSSSGGGSVMAAAPPPTTTTGGS